MNPKHAAALLLALAPLAAHAGTIRGEVRQDLAEARAEVRTDLAQERDRLENGNLSLDGLHFGKDHGHDARRHKAVPEGEITPGGDLLVDGKAVAIDAAQRRMLLAYRGQVIEVAKTGLDAGERAAMLAIDATDVSLFRMFVGAMTGSLERRVKATVVREIQPAVLRICQRLPQLRESQQALATSLPEFRPYATLEEDDVEDCERDVRSELAMR
ncbi:MAG TPA: hypothetical protein VM619_15080 [Luteimonas sp.]|nr:hypothetical protein [Luteimonas sp.]